MAETAVGTSVVKASADKFYDFFKFHMNDLVKVAPAIFPGVKLLEGEEGKVGNVKQWTYIIGGVTLTITLKLTALDDTARSLTFTALDGDVLLQYKSFAITLVFTDGLAKYTITYERATAVSPPPDAYIALDKAAFTLLDAYLLVN